jgi:hypothetical protein
VTEAPGRGWLRRPRLPAWLAPIRWPAAITVLMLGYWALATPAIVGAAPFSQPGGAELVRPWLYVAIAPLSDVLDALSMLSVPQLIALGIWVIALFVLCPVVRWRRRVIDGWCAFCTGIRALLILVLLVLLAAALPRPMARLVVNDPAAVVFDLHSHTNYSHDARATFTVEANREWHRASGFDAAYITDHRCFDGAAEGMRANPKLAGEGTVLLSGIELPPDQLHVIVLEPPDVAVPDGLLEKWCVRATTGQPLQRPPVRIQSIPEDLARMRVAASAADSGVIALEISDGAPRGMAQAQRQGGLILAIAAGRNLTLVAGSNNHGWGRTAIAWNVMHIPGWRGLAPDSLGTLIEMRIRAERQRAVQVITRAAAAGTRMWIIFTPVAAIRTMLATLSAPERLSWLVWTWGITAIVVLVRRRSK